MLTYDYVIIGAGIAGCSTAYELSKYSNSVLIVDQNSDVAQGASGAAGAFLSPLLGKPNEFKDLVTNSLRFSNQFYIDNFPDCIDTCGTTRIPKNKEDALKFKEYIPFNDFEYTEDNDGYFFKIGSIVQSTKVCKSMLDNAKNTINKKFNFKVENLEFTDNSWIINHQIKAQKIIFATGSDVSLVDEFYLKIRAVWGRRIDVSTTSATSYNYHKACSLSKSTKLNKKKNLISIGATHHRVEKDVYNEELNVNDLLTKANDIKALKDIEVLNHYIGARACSMDYFPLVGDIINSKKTLEEFPYLVNGTNVDPKRFARYTNSYILTGVGGRGFVLAPYLANKLVQNIVNGNELESSITLDRLFKREVKRIK